MKINNNMMRKIKPGDTFIISVEDYKDLGFDIRKQFVSPLPVTVYTKDNFERSDAYVLRSPGGPCRKWVNRSVLFTESLEKGESAIFTNGSQKPGVLAAGLVANVNRVGIEVDRQGIFIIDEDFNLYQGVILTRTN